VDGVIDVESQLGYATDDIRLPPGPDQLETVGSPAGFSPSRRWLGSSRRGTLVSMPCGHSAVCSCYREGSRSDAAKRWPSPAGRAPLTT